MRAKYACTLSAKILLLINLFFVCVCKRISLDSSILFLKRKGLITSYVECCGLKNYCILHLDGKAVMHYSLYFRNNITLLSYLVPERVPNTAVTSASGLLYDAIFSLHPKLL